MFNCFELCTKRTPRRLVTASWEKQLTLEEFGELNAAGESVKACEIEMEHSPSSGLVQVSTLFTVHVLSCSNPGRSV